MSLQLYINPFTPEILLVILLTVCFTILIMLVLRIWSLINLKSLIYIFLYSHNLSAQYCIDIVRRNSALAWSLMGVKGLVFNLNLSLAAKS